MTLALECSPPSASSGAGEPSLRYKLRIGIPPNRTTSKNNDTKPENSKHGKKIIPLTVVNLYHDPDCFTQHVPALVHKVALSMMHLFPNVEADELMQHCLPAIWKRRRKCRARKGKIGTWICFQAMSLLYDLARKNGREVKHMKKLSRVLKQQGLLGEIEAREGDRFG